MTILITRIDIDAGAERKNYLVQAKQGDKATRFVSVLIVEDGKEYAPPADADLLANFQKPDGKFAYNAAKIDEGNRILVELTNQVLAVPGEVVCEVEIRAKDSSQILTSCTFTVKVGRSNRNEAAILSSNEMTAFDTKWAEINADMEEWATVERLRVEAEQMLGLQLDWLLLLGWWVLASLIVNEARSILENLVEMGYDVPDFLVKGLAVTQKLIEAKNPAANLTDTEKEG